MKLWRWLFVFFFFFEGYAVYADGSRDLYPTGIQGNRAYLAARALASYRVFFNHAANYAYVNEGETIAVASSAQGVAGGRIVLTAPNGQQYTTTNGRIAANAGFSNRTAELAGPDIGYTPHKQLVQANQKGIWKIEFYPPSFNSIDGPPVFRADADWAQQNNTDFIAAWDISVRDVGNSHWIKGRVFTHVLNLDFRGALSDRGGGYYGKNYVLTNDGYIYQVDGNGSNGLNFYFFVNSTGFLDRQGNPTYKSSDLGFAALFHNPNAPDNGRHVTHKMMYTFPDVSMPQSASGPVPGGKTWLYQEIQIAKIEHVELKPVEGAGNRLNRKGGHIEFNTNRAGLYKIGIAPASGEYGFAKKEVIVDASVGTNSFLWDGLDGNGKFVPVGKNYPITISIALIGGEIHFPYFDMEINPQGIKISRYNADGSYFGPAMAYWDDSEISPGMNSERSVPLVNTDGISSYENGHKWGTWSDQTVSDSDVHYTYNGNYGAYSFGNERAMDTWSYTVQIEEKIEQLITVEVADLEVVKVYADKDIIELGEEVVYHIVVRNNGPSDVVGGQLEYSLPVGFFITNVSFDSDGGTTGSVQATLNNLHAQLDLLSGCSITYIIKAVTGSSVSDDIYGYIEAFAGTVRPLGYTDPDATSVDVTRAVLGTAEEECNGNCNNIKVNRDVFLLEPYEERGQLALLKTVQLVDTDGSGFPDVGERLEYTFVIRNTGFVTVKDIYLQDTLLSSTVLFPERRTLLVGEEMVLVHTYWITEGDIQRKYVENRAWVWGKNPRGFDVKDVSGTDFGNDDPTWIDIDQKPLLSLRKSVINKGTGENGQFTLGDNIVYRFEIRHGGDLSVVDLELEDQRLSPSPIVMDPSLVYNETIVKELSYTITEDDILAGEVTNSARVQGRDEKYRVWIADVSGTDFDNDIPTVTGLAIPPVGRGDQFDMYQGTIGYFDVLVNDLPGSSSLDARTIEFLSLPSLGELSVQGGKVVFRPSSNLYHGDDFFTYRVRDNSRLWSDEVRVDVRINRTVPVAMDDYFSVGYNYRVQVRPYHNDYVNSSELLRNSIRILHMPSHGTLTNLGHGEFRYVPEENYTGFDKFVYIIQDMNGNWSDPATVTLESKGFFLPNTITPNGDGQNDTFKVIGAYVFDQIELEVMDRFGKTIFHSADYQNDWKVDDTIQDGTYFYIFRGNTANAKPVIRKGYLLLKR